MLLWHNHSLKDSRASTESSDLHLSKGRISSQDPIRHSHVIPMVIREHSMILHQPLNALF